MSVYTRDTATTENLLRQSHRDRYIRDWIFATYPPGERDALKTQLEHVSNGMLIELYPNIWQHGPRGNVYMQQLHQIEQHLDTMTLPGSDMSWAYGFSSAMRVIAGLLNVDLRQRLTSLGVLRGYPAIILDPHYREQDPLFKTVNHSVWTNSDAKNSFATAMRTFRTVTLYMPILNTAGNGNAAEITSRFISLCDEFGLTT